MAGLSFSEVAVIEIQEAHQGAVIKSRPIGGGSTTANQGTQWIASKIIILGGDHLDRLGIQGTDGTAQRIQNPNLCLYPGSL